MRLDKYLKTARILKRREAAKELALQGRIWVNNRVAKPSTELKIGDTIRIRFGARLLEIRVLDIQKQVSKQNAQLLFEIIHEEIIDGKVMIAQRNYGSSKGFFEFPGGKVEENETKENALIREWKEECGIDIYNVQYLANSIDYQDGYEIYLTCFTCTSDEKPIKLSVHSEYIWTTPDHIYDYNFFKSDKMLVEALKEVWPCLIKQMKPKY